MASLGNQTLANEFTSYYLTNPTDELGIRDPSNNTVVALTASGNELLINGAPINNEPVSNWSLYPAISNRIYMDPSNILSNIGGDLYFNNELLAQAGQISNVADWSLYPAISNVNFNLCNANSIGDMVVISNSTIASCIGQGFGLLNYSLTQNQGDFILWSPVADFSNGNRPNATFEADNFRVGFTGKTLSGTTWYNQDNTPFEVVDQNTQAPISSAQPNFEIFARNVLVTTPAFTMTNTTPAVITGDTQQGQILSSNILPLPSATYTTAQVGGNLQVGTLSNGQLFPYPTARFAVDEFKVGNFIGESGGENAPAVNVNARSMALGSIGSTATSSVNGIAVSINGAATAGITSPVTTLTGGIVNITGAGGVAVNSPGGVAVTGGTIACDSPIGMTIVGGGGVAIAGGLGVSITGGAGVSVTGGGSVSLTGGGGISVNDLGGATFRGGNVLLTLGADQTIDNGTLTLSGVSSGLYAGSIRPNNTNALQIGDFGNTTTNPISLSNINSIQSFGAGGQIINMSLDLSGNNITNGGSITASNQVYTPQVITTDPDPSLYLVLRGGQGIEVRNSTSALGAVACRSVNLEDALAQVMVLTNDLSNVYANGSALAYASALSNWSTYPAISPVDMSGFGITNIQNMDFSNALTNPALKNIAVGQGIEVVSEQGLFVKNVNTLAREKIDAKTFIGDNIFLDGTVSAPSVKMTAGNDTSLYRINGDQQGTMRITNDPANVIGGFLLDSDINKPTFNLSGGNVLELKAKDPTTDPTGNTLKTLTSITLPNTGPYAYASFSATATQTVTAADTPTKVNFNFEDVDQGGFSLSSGSIIVPYSGSYEFIPSIIFTKTGGAVASVYFWMQVNGVDVPNSSTQITLAGNNEETCPAAALITASLNAGDNVALYFASDSASAQIFASAAQTSPYVRPATPAAIMTAKLLQTSAIATSAVDIGLQNRLQIVPVGTPSSSIVKFTGVGGVGAPSSWVPDNQPPIAGGTNNGWRFTKAVGAGNTAKINWYPFNPYYPSAPSIGVPPSTIILKKNLEALWFVISTQNDIAVQGMLFLQIYTYDYTNGSSTFFTNRWDYCSPIYSSSGMTTTPFTLESGFKYLVCAVDGIKNQNTPATLGSITYANGQYPSQRTTTKLRDPYDIHTDIPHLPFTFVAFNNTPTPQPADPTNVAISAFAINTSSSAVTTALDFTIEAVGYKAGGINYEYQLQYS